ncbi:conserved hypothetical protein [Xanthomonas citri pv. citri]|nr:conserved hypothetical protein [Xanthomonas citri pv. citri]CEH77521.1 conserved hypothetical protein [Xanthomonas citri pv. citri]
MDHQAGGFVDDGQDIVLVENLQMFGGYAHRRIIRIADTACHCIAALPQRTNDCVVARPRARQRLRPAPLVRCGCCALPRS